MTLPKITTDEDEVDGDTIEKTTERRHETNRLGSSRRAPGTGVRARALKQNDAYLTENLNWNDQLERCFVNLGLLREHVFGLDTRSSEDKTKEIIESLCHISESTTWKGFFSALTEHGNQQVADKVRGDIAATAMAEQIEEGISPRGRPKTPENTTLRRRLHSLERTARQWQIRAQQLEQEKEMLRAQSGNSRQAKVTGEDAAVKVGKLEAEKAVLNSELKLKDKGLAAWRYKENEYRSQIEQLTNRMDLMSSMIRNRDSEVEKYKLQESRYKEKFTFLHTQSEELSKKRKGLTEPLQVVKPAYVTKPSSKTQGAPGRLPALLPNQNLVTKGRKNTELPPLRPGLPKSHTLKNGMVLDFNTRGLKRDGGRDVAALATNRGPPPMLGLNMRLVAETAASFTTPGSPDEDTPLSCVLKEKRIDRKGGDIELERVALHVPPNSVPMSVLFSVTDTMHYEARLQQIKSAGLVEYLQPCMQVRLQPHGISFLRPVYLEMKDIKKSGELIVYHREVDVHSHTPWNDITNTCSPKFRKNDLVIALEHFSIVEAMKMLVPAAVGAAAGMAMGYHMSLKNKADAIMNKQTCGVDFHIYHKPGDSYLVVNCVEQDAAEGNNNKVGYHDIPGMKKLGSQPARFDICDKERLYFYFSNNHQLAASQPFDLEKCRKGGQKIHVTLPSGHVSVTAESLLIKRRIAENIEEQQLCCMKLDRDKCPLSCSSDSDFVDCSISESELKYERALRKCRLKIVKQLDVKDVMDYLRQEDVFNENEQEKIYAETTRKDRASVFIDRLTSKGPKAFDVFCSALRDGYDWLADDLKSQMLGCG